MIKKLIFLIVISSISLVVLFGLPGIRSRLVFSVGITILLAQVLHLKEFKGYIDDFKNLNNSEKEVLISKSLNESSVDALTESVTVAGFILSLYSAISYLSSDAIYDAIFAFFLIVCFYGAARMIKRAKALMYIGFINDKKKNLKNYQSSHKKFNRRRQR